VVRNLEINVLAVFTEGWDRSEAPHPAESQKQPP
jgi:hypothetical protein